MRRFYFVKRSLMRIGCLFGRHRYKMGVSAKGGGGFGCLWCGSPSRQKSEESDTLLTDAARHVRQLFGGRL